MDLVNQKKVVKELVMEFKQKKRDKKKDDGNENGEEDVSILKEKNPAKQPARKKRKSKLNDNVIEELKRTIHYLRGENQRLMKNNEDLKKKVDELQILLNKKNANTLDEGEGEETVEKIASNNEYSLEESRNNENDEDPRGDEMNEEQMNRVDGGNEETESDAEEKKVTERKKKKTSKTNKAPVKAKKPENVDEYRSGDDENQEQEEEEEYEVKKILEVRKLQGKCVEYKVRWKGYSSKDDTWEPATKLKCDELIKKFKKAEKKNESNARKESLKRLGKRIASPFFYRSLGK